jgi:cell volume regulation protein A
MVVIIGFSLQILMPGRFSLLEGMLLGAMVGGLGGISVSGILDRLSSVIPSAREDGLVINLESTISDPIRLVACLTLIKIITLQGALFEDGVKDIIFTFVMSTLLGSVGGLIWAEVLSMLRGRPFNYIMTVATLFPVYIMSEEVIGPGGGPIAALAFGLAITNYGYVTRRLGLKRTARVDKRRIREFNQEITFLIKAFFFVYLGLIVSFSLWYAVVGLGIISLMLITRYSVATGVSKLLMFTDGEKVFSRVVYMQGASALILAQLPIVFDPERLSFKAPEIFGDLCFPIIIGTVIFVSVLGPLIARRQLGGTKPF